MMVVVVFDMFGEKESRRKLGMVRGWTFTTMTTGMLSSLHSPSLLAASMLNAIE